MIERVRYEGMTFRVQWDELVFERNGARKGTVIGGEFRSNTKSKPRIFINESINQQPNKECTTWEQRVSLFTHISALTTAY